VTTTELATRTPLDAAALTDKQASLMQWVETARAVNQIAVGLVRTSFVPAAFKGKPEEATAAILAGHEVGLDPIASLHAFDVINGTAAPRAVTLRAILQSLGHDIWIEEQTDTRAVVKGQRKGSTRIHTSEWDTKRANGLKLTGKDNWKSQPKAMLIARATAECCRMTASDAIMGMPYSAEELLDGTPKTVRATATRAPRTIREAVAGSSSNPTLILDDRPEPDSDAATDATDGPDRDRQRKRLHAVLGELGIGADRRDDKIAALAEIAGRAISSSDDLTSDEATVAIDTLSALVGSDEGALILAELIGRGRERQPS
jgi:hypothetical protein